PRRCAPDRREPQVRLWEVCRHARHKIDASTWMGSRLVGEVPLQAGHHGDPGAVGALSSLIGSYCGTALVAIERVLSRSLAAAVKNRDYLLQCPIGVATDRGTQVWREGFGIVARREFASRPLLPPLAGTLPPAAPSIAAPPPLAAVVEMPPPACEAAC